MIQRIFRYISLIWLKIWRVYWRGHLISFHVARFYHTIIIFINDTEIKAHVDTIGTYPNLIPYLCNKYHSLLYNSFDSSSGVYPRFGSYRPMYHYALHKTRNIVTPLMQRENHGELKGYLSQIHLAELRARIPFFFLEVYESILPANLYEFLYFVSTLKAVWEKAKENVSSESTYELNALYW